MSKLLALWPWMAALLLGSACKETVLRPPRSDRPIITRDVGATTELGTVDRSLVDGSLVDRACAPLKLTLTATADSYVSEASPSSNFGAEDILLTDKTPDQQVYLRFSVSGLAAAPSRATLRLYVTNGSSDGPLVHAVTGSWQENTISWSNRPALGPALTDLGSVAQGWLEIDVSKAITGNGDYSFALVPTSSDGLDFESRETVNPPQLLLEAVVCGASREAGPADSKIPVQPDLKSSSDLPPLPDAGPPLAGAFTFFVIGDTRSTMAVAQQNYASMVKLDAKAIGAFNTGDITADGIISQWDAQVLAIETGSQFKMRRDLTAWSPSFIRYLGVIGNHDIHDTAWLANWNKYLPGQQSLGHNAPDGIWYSLTYQNAIFVVLDSTKSVSTQTAWLTQTLSSAPSTIKWKFVLYHYPVFTCSYKSPWSAGTAWTDQLEKYGVDMVFNGHAHVYERTCPMVKGKCQVGGVTYVTTGGGGAGTGDIYPTASRTAGAYPYSCAQILKNGRGNWHHYTHVQLAGNTLTYRAFAHTSSTTADDTFVLSKP